MPPSLRLAGLLVCISMLNTSTALAQPTATSPTTRSTTDETLEARDARETAQARALYEEGVAAAESEQWALAADRFERAQSLRPSAATAYNLAAALDHLGRLVEAAEVLRAMLRDESTPAQVRTAANTSLARIEPRIATLTIHVSGASDDTRIVLDGVPLKPLQLDVGIPVDPGMHVIAAWRDRTSLEEKSVTAAEGTSTELTLAIPAEVPASAAATTRAAPDLTVPTATSIAPTTTPTTPSRHARRDDSVLSQWWFWTAVGLVVGGAAVTATVMVAQEGHR